MKKAITIIILALCLQFVAKAQWVTIPDAHFVTYLQANFPSCMNGNLMDTTCSGITLTYGVSIDGDSIADLTGIQYFHNLHSLSCMGNQLTSLPTLPNLISDLYCGGNFFSNLPAMPTSLTHLDCTNDHLTSLPILPNSLKILASAWNPINSLPSILPDSLQTLQCIGNQLTILPVLPNGLRALDCSFNQIANLPYLPNSIYYLNCGSNQLTNINAPTNTFEYLICDHNQLTNLPPLSNVLEDLELSHNQFTSVPTLPNSLMTFWCDSNNIACFPVFPTTLCCLNISGNPYTCLPNYIAAMNSATLAYPLCVSGDLINNTNGCNGAQGVVGNIYQDNNSNCIDDAGDVSFSNIPIKLYDNNNNLLAQTYSYSNGIYDFPDSLGTYTIKVDTIGMPFTFQCLYPGIDSTVVLSPTNPLLNNVNFDVICKSGFDIGVRSVRVGGYVFPGLQNRLVVNAGDMSHWYNFNCAAGVGGQVQINISGPVIYSGILTGAITPSVVGNTFTYNITDFGNVNNSQAFGLLLTTDTSAQIGDNICVSVLVTPTIGDNNVTNNTSSFCYYVGNSYDPNVKETYPETVIPGFDNYFYYTIHFQNTGTASAQNIRITDSLSALLDVSTFQEINYSHANILTLNGRQLTVRFPQINLADSTSNFSGSQGFVQYRIKPLANLPAGTLIHNQASIYFDYNAPVVTNTTTNEFMLTTGIANNQHPASIITIAPNPFTSQTTITFNEEQKNTTIKITDVLGKEIKTINFSGKQCTIEKGEMLPGIYFVQVVDSQKNIVNRKIVVQ